MFLKLADMWKPIHIFSHSAAGTTGMVLAFIALGLEFYSVPRNKHLSTVWSSQT